MKAEAATGSVTRRVFGKLTDGREVSAWTLRCGALACEVLDYGAILARLWVPDRGGVAADVLLGFDHLEDWEKRNTSCFGAVAGRIAGRVPGGLLRFGGREFALAKNDGENHLHGGRVGLDKRLWSGESVSGTNGSPGVRLTYFSPDGEEGYPGNVRLSVTYRLTPSGELVFETEAASDQLTPISLTQHSYFNLAGEAGGPATGHLVQIMADEHMPTDERMTPLGLVRPVAQTAADLRHPRRIGDVIPRLWKQHGDLYRVGKRGELKDVAKVADPASGRVMTVKTTCGFLQFYAAGHLDGSAFGKGAAAYPRHAGLCFETEGYPDPGAGFGDTLVRPGEVQRHRTVYAFATEREVSP